MPIVFVLQGKCLFSDISRPVAPLPKHLPSSKMKIVITYAKSADPYEMLHFAAFHLGLHCLPKYLFMSLSIKRGKLTCGLLPFLVISVNVTVVSSFGSGFNSAMIKRNQPTPYHPNKA